MEMVADKNERGYWIRRKGREKFSDTGPERAFDECMAQIGIHPERSLTYRIDDDGQTYVLSPDRRIGDVVVEILGDYHMTALQETKTKWRTGLLTHIGKRVLLIDSRLLYPSKEWWPYVQKETAAFLSSQEFSKRLYA